MNKQDAQMVTDVIHELGVFFSGTNEEKINVLTDGYQAWIKRQELPNMSADDLLYSDHPLTDSQRKWLRNFTDLWESEID
tara:strand:+ start:523 stop:762 length:240 start_codon:yes stop_codon:yes gene_type:complete